MKKNLLKGVWPMFLLAAVFSVLPILVAGMLVLSGSKDFYLKDGRVYGETNAPVSVVNIEGLVASMGESADGKSEFFLVETNGRVVLFEAEKNNKDVARMIENPESLKEQPIQIVVKQVNDDVDEALNLSELDPQIVGSLERNAYISSYENQKSRQTMLMLVLAFLILPAFMLVLAITRIGKTKKSYDKLYSLYPELEKNPDLLATQSEYYDDLLKLAIYKNHLIVFSYGFDAVDIRELKRIEYILNTISYGAVSGKHFSFKMTKNDGSKEILKFKFKKANNLEERMGKLSAMLHTKNPSIQIN
ncbi:MAG: hypothetical protein Q4D65_05415 [Peptostreptococcaceae bacterium]|nr:hypothetical protein [Peptostreptococcaceae bacterium]